MFSAKSTTIAAAILLAHIAAAATCSRQYTVASGDTCDIISAAQNVSTFQLAAVNSKVIDASCSNLEIGEVLCLGNVGEDCTKTYVVKPLDTCAGITQFAGINSTMLYTNNPQIDSECSNVYIGEVLCIANTALVPSTAGPFAPVAPPTPAPAPAAAPAAPAAAAPAVAPAAVASDPSTDGSDGGDEPYCDSLSARDLEEYEWVY